MLRFFGWSQFQEPVYFSGKRPTTRRTPNSIRTTTDEMTFGNRFRIPIDFELLNNIGHYHQASLADKLEIKLTFNDKKEIILGSTPALAAAADADYDYSVTDISCLLYTSPSPRDS